MNMALRLEKSVVLVSHCSSCFLLRGDIGELVKDLIIYLMIEHTKYKGGVQWNIDNILFWWALLVCYWYGNRDIGGFDGGAGFCSSFFCLAV